MIDRVGCTRCCALLLNELIVVRYFFIYRASFVRIIGNVRHTCADRTNLHKCAPSSAGQRRCPPNKKMGAKNSTVAEFAPREDLLYTRKKTSMFFMMHCILNTPNPQVFALHGQCIALSCKLAVLQIALNSNSIPPLPT